MSKWYGSVNNRVDENKMFCDKIEVGTLLTEYNWSDRTPYEVVKVVNQNSVFVRELEHKHIGNGEMDNEWELFSDETKAVRELKKRYDYWNWVTTYTEKSLENWEPRFVPEDIYNGVMNKGTYKKYTRANISFGIGEYYYDYEF